MNPPEYVRITPSNYPSSSVISYKSGSPLINFIIGSKAKKIKSGSIRLNGKIKCFDADSNGLTDTNVVYDSTTGTQGLIDSLTISNSNNREYEKINSYNRAMASYLKQSQSSNDTNTINSLEYVSNGNLNGISTFTNGAVNNSFSMPLYSGLLTGNDYYLDSSKQNGMTLSVMLSPDSNFFYDITGGAGAVGCFYQLSDVHLSFVQENMTKEDMAYDFVEFITLNTHYGIASETYNTINFNLGLSSVLSWFINVLPQDSINNALKNSMETNSFIDDNDLVDEIIRLEFLVGGQKFPLNYNVEGTSGNQYTTEIYRNFADSFSPYMNTTKNYRNATNTQVEKTLDIIDQGPSWGMGVALDNISNSGFNGYMQEQFGLVVEKRSTSPKPHTLYLFIRNKQRIVF